MAGVVEYARVMLTRAQAEEIFARATKGVPEVNGAHARALSDLIHWRHAYVEMFWQAIDCYMACIVAAETIERAASEKAARALVMRKFDHAYRPKRNGLDDLY